MLILRGVPLGGGTVRGRAVLMQEGASSSAINMSFSRDHDSFSDRVLVVAGGPKVAELSARVEELRKGGACAILSDLDYPWLRKMVHEDGLTAVCNISSDYFLNGDIVSVDGSSGAVEIENVSAREVVNCMVQSNGKMLILKRSSLVGSFQGKWASVSGYIEENESPYEAALKEIREELSVTSPVLLRRGEAIITRKEGTAWVSHPFLFSVEEEIRIDWEHTEFRWIDLSELGQYETVPGLRALMQSLGIS